MLDAQTRDKIRMARSELVRKELKLDTLGRRTKGGNDDRVRTPRVSSPERVPQHGTASEYSNHGCRCELCMGANNNKRSEYKSKFPKVPCIEGCGNLVVDSKISGASGRCRSCATRSYLAEKRKKRVPKHGTRTEYVYYKCRCKRCTKAASLYRARKRKLANASKASK